MKKDDKVIEGTVEDVVVDTEVVGTKVVEAKKGLLVKAQELNQKHGKKLLAGIAIIGAGVLGYVVGKKAGVNSVDTDDCSSYDDTDDYTSEDNTEL